MSAGAESNAGAGRVREGHRFDEAVLAEWMARTIPGFEGPMTVEQFNGGQSNPTYKLSAASGQYVLRRKPPGKLLKGAHAIEREVRVLTSLGSVGFPVPKVYGLCTEDEVIGTWFYVMEMVEGRIFWDATLVDAPRAERPALFDAMNDTLAKLHTVDFEAVGLGDYGRTGNYFQRQIARWSKQYLDDAEAGRDPAMDALVARLPDHIPGREEVSLVHGDLRIDNMIFHPTEPRVIAVLDWELSTLGHPFADFAYNAMMYHMPPDIVAGLLGADLAALNLPSEDDYIAAYCARTGRSSIPNYRFYLAFNFFRLAAIFHGIKGRAIRGNASSQKALERGEAFHKLAAIGLVQLRQAELRI